MVSATSFGWFADFGKTLTIIKRSSQLVCSDLTSGKHPWYMYSFSDRGFLVSKYGQSERYHMSSIGGNVSINNMADVSMQNMCDKSVAISH